MNAGRLEDRVVDDDLFDARDAELLQPGGPVLIDGGDVPPDARQQLGIAKRRVAVADEVQRPAVVDELRSEFEVGAEFV